jgi:hypothetical protein
MCGNAVPRIKNECKEERKKKKKKGWHRETEVTPYHPKMFNGIFNEIQARNDL